MNKMFYRLRQFVVVSALLSNDKGETEHKPPSSPNQKTIFESNVDTCVYLEVVNPLTPSVALGSTGFNVKVLYFNLVDSLLCFHLCHPAKLKLL